MVGSMYHSSKYLILHAIFKFYKSQIRMIMDYSCHLERAAPSSLFSFVRVPKCVRVLVCKKLFSTLQSRALFHRWDVANISRLYLYFHRKCLDGLHFLVLPVLIYMTRTRHATNIVTNHPHSLHALLVINKFYCWVWSHL